MGFSDNIKKQLQSSYTGSLVDVFYKPLLSEATLYQRVSAYFTSEGLDLLIDGIEELVRNDGTMEFIISKQISKKDYEKIHSGYTLFNELKPLKLAERNEKLSPKIQKQLGNLAFMIAMGKARVKIAFTDRGDFHDKFGIISSGKEKVFFNGSANETQSGINVNYESITVDVSWDNSQNVISRVRSNVDRFNRLWKNEELGVTVIEASDLAYEEFAKYQSQSDIQEFEIVTDEFSETELREDHIIFILMDNKVVRVDTTEINLTNIDRKLKKGSDLTQFFEEDNSVIKETTTYKDIERIINVTKKRAKRKAINVIVSKSVKEFLARNKYSIEQYKIIGDIYKNDLNEFPSDKLESYKEFIKIVQSEVERPLYDLHLRAAYYQYEMSRVANFSVPGAGKTAMILGVFAFLNRQNAQENEKVERILVISPISAFESWKQEFKAVFGAKKQLYSIDSQSLNDFEDELNLKWGISNLVLVNYESLLKYSSQLKQLLGTRTMLVFDEVHRIKNPFGIRAAAALDISRIPKFKYVLTGTPIPNSYQDIYNFLHILYSNEYSSYFGWDISVLSNPRVRQINGINQKLYPFFWRTNKDDLGVPKPDSDLLTVVKPSSEQLDLAESIYYNETSSLARLIRLIQASTNPSLVTEAINYKELMSYDEEGDLKGISEDEFNKFLGDDLNKKNAKLYSDLKVDSIIAPKFIQGINLVENLVSEGKKVLVWGIFVDTLHKIAKSLREKGIKTNLVYGGTDKSERVDLINNFRYGNTQVLVSNPQTLGEAISLHQTVHDAVYFEYNFNLTFMLQSRDRIHRLGLDSNQYTRYHYLQTEDEDWSSYRPGFIDEKIYKRLKEKEEIMYAAIDNNNLSIEYGVNEILEAIRIIDEERERIRKNS